MFGASIICVDIIVRHFPGKKDFRIQDSDAFLSASLSLSFGVMVRFSTNDVTRQRLTYYSSSRHCIACFRLQRAP